MQPERQVSKVFADAWGSVSPSVYETARLIALAPWLDGHRHRLDFLLDEQAPGGHWGPSGGLGLVPTLSAVEALLVVLGRGDREAAELRDRVDDAAAAGLRSLAYHLDSHDELPDTAAHELIVPTLVAGINRLTGPAQHLLVPAGLRPDLPEHLRQTVGAAGTVPGKLLHAFEAFADERTALLVPDAPELVGGSPAATAAWIRWRGGPDQGPGRAGALAAVVRRQHGLVPSVTPTAPFERLWVLAILLTAGCAVGDPTALREAVRELLGPAGAPGVHGLPPDADDTATALHLLGLLGEVQEPAVLRRFETPTHFACYLGEHTPSPTANAHVLEALGLHRQHTGPDPWADEASAEVVSWLDRMQAPDGSWSDKWHSSPWYALYCCAPALDTHGGPAARAAVARALDWLRSRQHGDGSFGVDGGSREETAYAVLTLARCTDAAPGQAEADRELLGLARAFLLGTTRPDPALWQDKDLYTPQAVVEAAVTAALEVTDRLLITAPGPALSIADALAVIGDHFDGPPGHRTAVRAAEVAQVTRAWAEGHKGMPQAPIPALSLVITRANPELTPAELELMMRAMMWIYALDDLFDTAGLADQELQQHGERYLAVLAGDRIPAHARAQDALVPPLEEIVAGLAAYPLFARLRPHLVEQFAAVMGGMRSEHSWQHALRRQQQHEGAVLPGFAENVAVGRRSIGGPGYYAVALILLDDASAEDVLPQLDELSMQAGVCMRLANDLATHRREREEGGVNAVLLRRTAAGGGGRDPRRALAEAETQVARDLHWALTRLGALAATRHTDTGRPERALLRIAHATCAQYGRVDFRSADA
ncbi:terpene synthase family protein [Kitasatospora sp. LaBMicrA B282]|uniref:terpene synthase family protein n=1 Tax=Kitasatospora sp. LaBMicrA B282 TaxID=3420949 RepID=UPI003D09CEAA